MLNELVEDYQDAEKQDKVSYLKEFKNMLWKSKFRFKTYKRYYTYKVNEKSLDHRKDLIDLFNKYKVIEFTFCKSFYNSKLDPIDYIRIHINNMYGYLVNKDVYLSKKYYQLLLTPKKEYYSVIKSLKNNEEVDCDEIYTRIEIALSQAEKIKEISLNKKLNLKWTEYKKLINTYIDRLFKNYIPPHEYEEIHGWEMRVNIDGWNEDNYLIRYFCKSLTGYLMNYVKDLNKAKEKKCLNCGKDIDYKTKRKYCDECGIEIDRNKARERMKILRLERCSK